MISCSVTKPKRVAAGKESRTSSAIVLPKNRQLGGDQPTRAGDALPRPPHGNGGCGIQNSVADLDCVVLDALGFVDRLQLVLRAEFKVAGIVPFMQLLGRIAR